MTDSSKCPQCGSDLPASFPPGFCPVCLMQQGMLFSSHNSVVGAKSGSGGSVVSERRRRWTPPSPDELAARFPQLEIISLLGQGGMGAVYKIRQRDLDRWAALKILPDEVADDPNFAERFQREARALAQLGHQNIVAVYEFGQRDGVYFLLMEYIDGVTLRQAIRAREITDRDALTIIPQICEALQFAHEEGIVHRDIKPENILIDRRGRVKIADFGLAKLLGPSFEVPTLTRTHQVMGTPVYMAPEQMEGTRGVDHRADIFSLGVVFYELLTGELPLGRFDPPSQKHQLDARLDDVVLRTLEKEPDRRYQQASDVKQDVESIRNQPRVKSAATSTSGKSGPERRSFVKRMMTASLSILACFGGFILIGLLSQLVTIQSQQGFRRARAEQFRVEDALATTEQELQTAREDLEIVRRKPLPTPAHWRSSEPEKPVRAEPVAVDDTEIQDVAVSAHGKVVQESNHAIVWFGSGEPKLNPSFGVKELSGSAVIDGDRIPSREIVNRLLAKYHKEYLNLERRYVQWSRTESGVQISMMIDMHGRRTGVQNLEDQFWAEIDSQLTAEQQRFLRRNLPLYVEYDARSDEFLHHAAPFGWSQRTFVKPGAAGRHSLYPICVAVRRQGKWFEWSILTSAPPSGYAGWPNEATWPIENWLEYDLCDSGSDVELPMGIRHFWREIPTEDPNPSEVEEPAISEVVPDRNESQRREVPVAADEIREDDRPARAGRWRRGREAPVAAEEVREEIREEPLPARDRVDRDVADQPERQNRSRQGNNPGNVDAVEIEEAAEAPSVERVAEQDVEDQRVLEKVEVLQEKPDLYQELSRIECDPQNDQSMDEAKRRIDELLEMFPSRSDRGHIHVVAVQLLGRNLRRYGSDVTQHATEGLKCERVVLNRAKLFQALGMIAEIHDNEPASFVNSRTEATKWYLKGLAELMPLELPDKAPELPKFDSEGTVTTSDETEIDADQYAAELRFFAQRNRRQEAERIRTMVERRDAYIDRLKDLFGRLHEANDKEGAADQRFREICDPYLSTIKNPETVERLTELLQPFLQKPEKAAPAPPAPDVLPTY